MNPTPKKGAHEWDCKKDDEAWRKIISFAESGMWKEANEVFLTRCAESAQEALAEDEKRRAALEVIAKEVIKTAKELGIKSAIPHEIKKAMDVLNETEPDALTPTQDKE